MNVNAASATNEAPHRQRVDARQQLPAVAGHKFLTRQVSDDMHQRSNGRRMQMGLRFFQGGDRLRDAVDI